MKYENASVYGINRDRTSLLIQKFGYNFHHREITLPVKKKLALKRLLKHKKQGKNLFFFTLKSINYLKDNRTYRGVRHRKNLPVRGQRSHTNAKTNKTKAKKLLQAAQQRKAQSQSKTQFQPKTHSKTKTKVKGRL